MQWWHYQFVDGFWKAIACFVSWYVSVGVCKCLVKFWCRLDWKFCKLSLETCGRKRFLRIFSLCAVATELLQQDQRAWTKWSGPTGYFCIPVFISRAFYAITLLIAVSCLCVITVLTALSQYARACCDEWRIEAFVLRCARFNSDM